MPPCGTVPTTKITERAFLTPRVDTLLSSASMSINKEIEHRVSAFVSELTVLVRQAAVDAVADVLGGTATRGPGRPKGSVSAKAPSAKPAAKGGKRTPEQIAATLETVVAYIKSHPNTRSEAIRAALKLPKPVAHDTLTRLRDAKKIKMRGVKRAATYTVA